MIFAGSILVILSMVYCFFVFKRFKQVGYEKTNAQSLKTQDQIKSTKSNFFSNSAFYQKADFVGNILIILFFGFLGTMFIINNL